MRVEIDAIEVELQRDDGVVSVRVRALSNGEKFALAVGYLNADEDYTRVRIGEDTLRRMAAGG